MKKHIHDGRGLDRDVYYLETGVRNGEPNWSVTGGKASAVRRLCLMIDGKTFPASDSLVENPRTQAFELFNKKFYSSDILGWSAYAPFNPTNPYLGGYLLRHPPARHPAFPGLYATGINVKGLGWISSFPITASQIFAPKDFHNWRNESGHPFIWRNKNDIALISHFPGMLRNTDEQGFYVESSPTSRESPFFKSGLPPTYWFYGFGPKVTDDTRAVQKPRPTGWAVEDFTIFPMYEYEITYSPLDYKPFSDIEMSQAGLMNVMGGDEKWRYVQATISPTVESQTVPLGFFLWSEGPAARSTVPMPLVKMLSFCELKMTWYQIPPLAVPYGVIFTLLGKVNSRVFYVPQINWSFWPHHVLFSAVSFETYSDPFGMGIYHDITYTFKINMNAPFTKINYPDSESPNKAIQYYQASVDGKFYVPGNVPPGKLLFDEANFDLLFVPGLSLF